MEKCRICDAELKNIKSLTTHLKLKHNLTYYEYKSRFDLFPRCKWCNEKIKSKNPGNFCNRGCKNKYDSYEKYKDIPDIPYCRICGLKGKTLIAHVNRTHNMSLKEYMEKFNLSKKDVHHESYLDNISERVSGENNPAYNHNGKYSPFSENFIKYEGLSKEEKEEKVKEMFENRTERKPEDNYCRLEYFMKFTDNIEEAKKLYSERQCTFSYEKCVEKYGEEEGQKRWKKRQKKWLSSYKKLNYSKISQELFWKLYENIKNDFDEIYFATLDNNKKLDESGKNYEYKIETFESYVKLDFFIKALNKVIEFDGDYWHGEKRGNKKRDQIREENILKNNPEFKIMHVKERDYKTDSEEIIKQCLDFIYD